MDQKDMDDPERAVSKSTVNSKTDLSELKSNDMNDAPPSYESLFGKLKAVKETSKGNKEFAMSACVIIANSVVFTIFLGIMLAVPVSAIIIGALYKDDCPAERFIPIYLIIFGTFCLVKNLSSLIQNIKRRRNEEEEEDITQSNKSNCFDGLLIIFLFAWFIAGNVWVYRLNGEWSSDSAASNYCHPTLYYYSYWLITSTYILMGVCFTVVCLVGVFFCFASAVVGE